jgi:hypothetical protein
MKLLGYAPDVDETQEGVIIDCSAFIPTEKGMQSAPSASDIGIDALAAQCYGAAFTRDLDDTFRVFAGTQTKLYELSGTSWTDRTRASGGDYNLGATDFWRFAQFGDTTLAVNKTDVLQSSATGAFADVSGAPKASIVETVGNQVFLCDTDDATYGDSPNRWWCSGLRDFTDWTPSITTQVATNTLVSTSGRITGAKAFGNQIVIYKERSMYIGTYVGAPAIWDFNQIAGDAGCSSNEAIVNIGTLDNPVHIFMGKDDFWRFDGARPIPIGAPLRRTVYEELDPTNAYKIKSLLDRVNQRIYFFYPSKASGGSLNKCVVYHYRTGQWGRDDRVIEASFNFISGGYTYDTLDTVSTTYDGYDASLTFNSPFWTSGDEAPALFNSSHVVNTLSGKSGNSSFTMHDIGDDTNFLLLKRVKPRWLTRPTSAVMVNSCKNSQGDTLEECDTTTMFDSRFDVLRSARIHRLRFDMVGDALLNDVNVFIDGNGDE